jgi:hypothetical protein
MWLGSYECRAYWFKQLNSIDYNENPIGYKIAYNQYRAALGWN